MRFLLYTVMLAVLLVRAVLWLLFVPLSRVLLKASHTLGPARLPFLVLCAPVWLPAMLLDRGPGRSLEGDWVRPTFSLPYAFARGPWRPSAEQSDRFAQFEVGEGADVSTLRITTASPIQVLRREDPMLARAIDRSLEEPALESGMRWTGVRVRTNFFGEGPLTAFYYVWNVDAPDEPCVQLTFTGSEAHELLADAFASSAIPAIPEPPADDAPEPASDEACGQSAS